MLSLAYAVGLTYTLDFVYNSLYLLPSESSWLLEERSSVACLLISTMSSVWGVRVVHWSVWRGMGILPAREREDKTHGDCGKDTIRE